MNGYTGFGQDPFYIYSFRGERPQEGIGLIEGIKSLRESLAYKQAGMEGKARMERVVSMGLPANTDINRIEQVGYDPTRQQPIYRAPRPQPWGTWGSFGGREKREVPAPVPPMPVPAGGPQPAQKPSPQPTPQPARTPRSTGYIQSQYGTGFSRIPMGFTGEPASFTSGGRFFGMAPKPTPTSTPIPFPELNTRNYFSSTMGNLKFPFANY